MKVRLDEPFTQAKATPGTPEFIDLKNRWCNSVSFNLLLYTIVHKGYFLCKILKFSYKIMICFILQVKNVLGVDPNKDIACIIKTVTPGSVIIESSGALTVGGTSTIQLYNTVN